MHMKVARISNLVTLPRHKGHTATKLVCNTLLLCKKSKVPCLSQVSALVLGMVTTVESAKGNHKGVRMLVMDIAEVVEEIVEVMREKLDAEEDNTILIRDLKRLHRKIAPIAEIIDRKITRNWASRVLHSQSDAKDLRYCHEQWMRCLTTFGFYSDLALRRQKKVKRKLIKARKQISDQPQEVQSSTPQPRPIRHSTAASRVSRFHGDQNEDEANNEDEDEAEDEEDEEEDEESEGSEDEQEYEYEFEDNEDEGTEEEDSNSADGAADEE
ncbi:hypothetical protein BDN72DRAFT_906215 [Pluteus cervinus]|uniref:Uncharacterized protein n=1 Tax=Pluteus cervinus TaxID=181527 RepID=A0ACD3A0D3_9AGAR|nr:hypothetical protein BDN72DRAFT_906215 [Pluteus cervinus]